MDLSQAIVAKSDQLNADDLISGPRTFTISEVRQGDSEQPVAIVLKEYPSKRPWKPSKTALRCLTYAFGSTETDNWPKNPRITLYREATVKWAGQEVGGIRVAAVSHIDQHPDLKDGKLKIALAETKGGKKQLHVIDALPNDAPATQPDAITAEQLSELNGLFARLSMDKDSALSFYESTTGRKVPNSKALTTDEAVAVIAGLKELEGGES